MSVVRADEVFDRIAYIFHAGDAPTVETASFDLGRAIGLFCDLGLMHIQTDDTPVYRLQLHDPLR